MDCVTLKATKLLIPNYYAKRVTRCTNAMSLNLLFMLVVPPPPSNVVVYKKKGYFISTLFMR